MLKASDKNDLPYLLKSADYRCICLLNLNTEQS